MKFNELGLADELLRAISDLGYEEPTEIQERAIPMLLNESCDLVGLAQTGTGKTAAFGLPLLDKIDVNNKSIQGLVLSPTRELCNQICSELEKFAKYKKVKMTAVYGGASIEKQMKDLKKGVHLVAATPGRLIDMLSRKALSLEEIDFLVLDEADEMLNMGFKKELDKILAQAPSKRVTWLFSATMPADVRRIAAQYMNDPKEITVGTKNSTNTNITHKYIVVPGRQAYSALCRVIDRESDFYGIIFCQTKRETQDIAEKLSSDGFKADALHGDMSQGQRDRVMMRFKKGHLRLLVATDVAARGIDVDDLTHVIHFHVPDDIESYTHRSGRTGRAGNKGESIAIIAPKEIGRIRALEKVAKTKFEKEEVPSAKSIAEGILDRKLNNIQDDKAEKFQELHQMICSKLEGLSKEELIEYIASMEMKGNLIKYWKEGDLNVSESRIKDMKNTKRYFINLGSKDQLNGKKLAKLVADVYDVPEEDILDCDVKNTFSFISTVASQNELTKRQKTQSKYRGRPIRIEKAAAKR